MYNTSSKAIAVIHAMAAGIPIVKRNNECTNSKWEDVPTGERPDWGHYIYDIKELVCKDDPIAGNGPDKNTDAVGPTGPIWVPY